MLKESHPSAHPSTISIGKTSEDLGRKDPISIFYRCTQLRLRLSVSCHLKAEGLPNMRTGIESLVVRDRWAGKLFFNIVANI